MRIFGHPVHVILIHFPSALFPMDFVCSLLAFLGGPVSLTDAAYFASFGGVLSGVLAVITGAFDLVGVIKNKPGSVNKAFIHGSLNTTVLVGFAVTTFLAYKQYPLLKPDGIAELVTKGSLVAILAIGNHLGGGLILDDKIGVKQ